MSQVARFHSIDYQFYLYFFLSPDCSNYQAFIINYIY